MTAVGISETASTLVSIVQGAHDIILRHYQIHGGMLAYGNGRSYTGGAVDRGAITRRSDEAGAVFGGSDSSGSDVAPGVIYKSDESPLTRADVEGHEYIVRRLAEQFPHIPVISEEGAMPGIKERERWDAFFLVDPLDGTKEFLSRNGEFTVNIALLEREAAGFVPVLGVVGVPATGVIYVGDRAFGSVRMEADGSVESIVSRVYDLGEPASIVVSRSHGEPATLERLTALGIVVSEQVPSGSSLKFCLLAEGRADLYPRLGPTMEWDTAAADAVFRYSVAPGQQPRWSPLMYGKPSLRNPGFVLGLGEADHLRFESQTV